MAERREQLLDAALAIIDRDGYDGVSIDAIARDVGVTRPVVYRAFDGLGDLLMTLLDRQQRRATDQLFAVLPTDPGGRPLRDVIAETLPALHEMVNSDPITWRTILQAPQGVPDVVHDRIAGDRQEVHGMLQQLIAAGLPDAVRDTVDTEVYAHAVMAVLERFGDLILKDPTTYTADRLTDAVLAAVPEEFGKVRA